MNVLVPEVYLKTKNMQQMKVFLQLLMQGLPLLVVEYKPRVSTHIRDQELFKTLIQAFYLRSKFSHSECQNIRSCLRNQSFNAC